MEKELEPGSVQPRPSVNGIRPENDDDAGKSCERNGELRSNPERFVRLHALGIAEGPPHIDLFYALSAFISSALSLILPDATFSSKCATEDVPGMGSMTGERWSNHASASW